MSTVRFIYTLFEWWVHSEAPTIRVKSKSHCRHNMTRLLAVSSRTMTFLSVKVFCSILLAFGAKFNELFYEMEDRQLGPLHPTSSVYFTYECICTKTLILRNYIVYVYLLTLICIHRYYLRISAVNNLIMANSLLF